MSWLKPRTTRIPQRIQPQRHRRPPKKKKQAAATNSKADSTATAIFVWRQSRRTARSGYATTTERGADMEGRQSGDRRSQGARVATSWRVCRFYRGLFWRRGRWVGLADILCSSGRPRTDRSSFRSTRLAAGAAWRNWRAGGWRLQSGRWPRPGRLCAGKTFRRQYLVARERGPRRDRLRAGARQVWIFSGRLWGRQRARGRPPEEAASFSRTIPGGRRGPCSAAAAWWPGAAVAATEWPAAAVVVARAGLVDCAGLADLVGSGAGRGKRELPATAPRAGPFPLE